MTTFRPAMTPPTTPKALESVPISMSNLPVQPEVVDDAAPAAQHPLAVGVVHHR